MRQWAPATAEVVAEAGPPCDASNDLVSRSLVSHALSIETTRDSSDTATGAILPGGRGVPERDRAAFTFPLEELFRAIE